MPWKEVVLYVLLAGTAAVLWWRTAAVWRRNISRGSSSATRLEAVGPVRAALAVALAGTDVLVFFLALAAADLASGDGRVTRLAHGVEAATAIAFLPLLVLWYTTGRYGRPAFLVPPWARGGAPNKPPKRSPGMRVRLALFSFTLSLAVVVVGLGILWLFAATGLTRLWGLLAAAVGVTYLVWGAGVMQRTR